MSENLPVAKKSSSTVRPLEYTKFIASLKAKIRSAQLKAAVSVNKELIQLYWEIGTAIIEKQKDAAWGSKIVEKLAKDLSETFPDMKGFSLRNVRFMVQFAREYPDFEIVKQLVSLIPWGHNILLLQKLSALEDRAWYINKIIENGWSRNVLLHWVDSEAHKRQGKALTNFKNTLPSTQSDLAQEILKDPYNFDFITLREKFDEKELEDGLISHIQKFLLELGAGFAFIGRQVNLCIGDQDFFIDLLFYHVKLRRYFVVELKTGEFKPEYTGKMNFYLTAVDKNLKHKDDEPTIGLLLCKTKNKTVVEYALQDVSKPIGVADYETKIVESLPESFKGSLPTIEDIEAEIEEHQRDTLS